MAAKIYTAPKEVKLPENSFQNVEAWRENEEKYIADLKQHLQKLGYTGKNMGEIIKFPVADGYAMYMVASMKPLMLIHLAIGDAWSYRDVDLMTATRVQEKIDQQKALDELFSRKG